MDNVKLKTKDVKEGYYSEVAEKLLGLQNNIEIVIKGKSEVIQICIIGLIARGHILIEDIPGVGKSTLAQCIAASLGLSFHRIQFTSDLLPSDIIGLTLFDEKSGDFQLRKGPIFANIILADEINRSTPKTQSALLEAMNDARITIDNDTHVLPIPFMVLATQNPVDHRGTFPLPESQMDRFMLRVRMGYPDFEYEREILKGHNQKQATIDDLQVVLTQDELLRMQNYVETVSLSEILEKYLLQIVHATRESEFLALGCSTRGALALSHAAKARALFFGRNYCLPDDVKALAVPVLSHRVLIEQRSGTIARRLQDVEDIISEIVSKIPVPV
jgi:MoxR-like ATPase